MKNISIVMIIGLLLLFSNCEEVDKLTQFEMEYTSELTIPASNTVGLPIEILTPEIETNAEEKFAVNDTRKDHVEEIILRDVRLSILSPSGQTFDFLKTIEVYISADGLEETLIAWKENVPDDVGQELDLNNTKDDLKDYIKKDEFKLRFYAKTDKTITQDVKIEVYSRFFVDAKVLGI